MHDVVKRRWGVLGVDRRDGEDGEECPGCDGPRRRIGAGGLAYKGENGDPYWMGMKGQTEMG
jgi:hypothetical protein